MTRYWIILDLAVVTNVRTLLWNSTRSLNVLNAFVLGAIREINTVLNKIFVQQHRSNGLSVKAY